MTTLAKNAAGSVPLEPAPPTSGLRWLLIGVCCALLGLLLVSGALAVRFLGELHTQELAVTRTLAERTETLSGLWLSIQSYNQAVQQFVAQAKADQDQAARRRLDQLALEIAADLSRYPRDRDAEEDALLAGMQNVFSQQRTIYISILDAPPEERRRKADSLLAERVMPVQKEILDWSAKLRTWNGDRIEHMDHALVTEFERLQGGLMRALTIGLGSGLLLVLGSMAHIVRLERQTRSRYFELARSRYELRQLSSRLVDAQETERRSISRELHDEIGQAVGAMLVDIGRLSAVLAGDRPETKAQLDNLKSTAERTVQAVRNIALLLRPSMLDDLGLAAALEWQGREVSRRSEIEVTVESTDVPDELPDEYRICIYRLVQEALNNAVRHSGARNAKVTFETSPQGIAVRVSDDGRGFDPGRVRGLGILGMEERVKRLGGTFTIESRQGQGATVAAELPLPPAGGGHA